MFEAFGKIPRLNRECVITEKIDGTNAQIYIEDVEMMAGEDDHFAPNIIAQVDNWYLFAGSRKRFITPENDNFGFAQWVQDNACALATLGPGRHFGEWWGQGIQRKYGMTHKVFSLFNTSVWNDGEARPECCDVVPTLYAGPFTTSAVNASIEQLRNENSPAADWYGVEFDKPEGVMVYHVAANQYFKVTVEQDESPKGRPS